MKIHLNSRQGLYEVEKYGRNTITVSTKHNIFQVPIDDFKSFAGGSWNFNISKEEMDTFLSIVQPEKYKKQFELENKIISLAKRIDIIDQLKASVNTSTIEEAVDDDIYEPVETTAKEYEEWWRKATDENIKLNNKMRSIAREVYSQNLDFSNFQNHEGIKFIIQTDASESKFRFCWDPYGFVSNYHSDISNIFAKNNYYTVNGGWIKIIGDNVILYYKSGDYGVYDDVIATECAKKVFPGKKIHSFAGRAWDDDLKNSFDMPF